MKSSRGGPFEVTGANICQNCGRLTLKHEEHFSNRKLGIVYPLIGWMFFFISLVFIPLMFGAVAFCMGLLTYFERNKVHGVILMIFAAAGLILGSMISFMVAGTMFI
ncbi:hypothetical protein ACIFOT_05630 [Neobacillus sp. NRS-1170]|uniref:hypothetical protein n=1 Tax=Neobacillus sp. NRS-1170 TaxID=3233898 RepID=UPI003D2B7D67